MKKILVIPAAAALLSLGACGPSPQSPKKLKVGAIISLTGNYGALGSERLGGVLVAADELNQNGGVLGMQLEVVSRDDATEPTQAKTIAQELVDTEQVAAIIGAAASGSTLAVSEVTIPGHVVQISGSSTSPKLSDLQDDGYVNRTCPSDALQSKLIAQRARARGFDRMAVIYAPNAYGEGLANAFDEAFTAAGGTVTAKVIAESGQTSYLTLLGQVFATNPQAILLVTYTVEGVQVMKDYLDAYSANGTFWYYPDSLADSAFVTAVGADKFTFGHEGTGPAAPQGPRYEAFAKLYEARYGKRPESTSFAANFYDATHLLALAIEAAGSVDGPSIRDQLPLVSSGGDVFTAQQHRDAIAAVTAGKDINYEGASGSVDLDAHGEPVAPYDVWKVQAGAITVTEAGVNP